MIKIKSAARCLKQRFISLAFAVTKSVNAIAQSQSQDQKSQTVKYYIQLTSPFLGYPFDHKVTANHKVTARLMRKAISNSVHALRSNQALSSGINYSFSPC